MDLKSEKKIIKGVWEDNCIIRQEGEFWLFFFCFFIRYHEFYNVLHFIN
jgi:hypothetical protein